MVHLDVPTLGAHALVKVRQSRGAVAGPEVSIPPPMPQPHTRVIPAPELAQPLCECDRAIRLQGIFPGAVVTVDRNGEASHACVGGTSGTFWLPRGVRQTDDIRIRQAYFRCEVASEYTPLEVTLARPPPPAFPYPVCAGDREVEVANLREGAVVQFLIGKGTATIVTAEAGPPPFRFILPPLGNVQQLGCRQSTCGEAGPWSETTWTDLLPVGSNDQPVIEEPVVRCGTAVGMWGLSAGTRVFIVSAAWGGPIGDAVAEGDALTVVPLYFSLIEGDQLRLELLRCGQRRRLDRVTVVRPAPDVLPPLLFEPLDDAGGTITVDRLVPGALCDIEQVATRDAEHGTLLATQAVARSKSSISVPPLPPGMLVRARQRLCGTLSRPSLVVAAGDRPLLPYQPGYTHRICQLTGTWGDGHRPARFDTNQIGIRGTDLGVPVVHHGRLYLLFGDTDTTEALEDRLEAADPIAWTVESPETPGGPLLHWAVGAGGAFHRLHLDGLPPLGYLEVATGAFSYNGRMYVFVARDRSGDAMVTSHLGVTKEPHNDPALDTLTELFMVSSVVETNAPAKKWLVHVSPTVIDNADWPGLPKSTGDGLLLFGSSDYQHSALYLAWTPLEREVSVPIGTGPGKFWTHGSGLQISYPSDWYFFVGDPHGQVTPSDWKRAFELGDQEPTQVMPPSFAEVSVTWHPPLRRWLLARPAGSESHRFIAIYSSRKPWGPWYPANYEIALFDGVDPTRQAGADNFEPGHQFTNLDHETADRKTVPYAPYLIPSWTRFDRSIRVLTVYYTMSTEHPPYEVMLMRSRFVFQ